MNKVEILSKDKIEELLMFLNVDDYEKRLFEHFFTDECLAFIIRNREKNIVCCIVARDPKELNDTIFVGYYKNILTGIEHSQAVKLIFDETKRHFNGKDIYGPICFNTWLSHRFRIDDNPNESSSWEPKRDLEAYEDFESQGFKRDLFYNSPAYDDFELFLKLMKPAHDKALEDGFKFTGIDLKNNDFLNEFYQINVDGFKMGDLFTPITREQYKISIYEILETMDLSLSYMAILDDKIVGYVFSFQDGEKAIMKTVVVSNEIKNSGVAKTLLYLSVKKAYEDGYKSGVCALVREGNISEKIFRNQQSLVQANRYCLMKWSSHDPP